jgi:serine protease Do
MSSEYSRWEGLGLLGAAGVGSVAISGRAAGLADGGAPPLARNLEEECDRLAALEAEYEELQASTKTLATEIERIEGRLVQERARYPESVRDHAREVGLSIRDSVAFLDMDDGHGSGGEATGWFVDDRHVMTNAHNVFGRTSATAWTVDGSSFDVEVVELVENLFPDVALLRADSAGTPLPLGSASSLEPGDTVVQVGHPGEVGNWLITVGRHMHSMGLEDGADSPPDGYATVPELTTSAPGAQGNSGSPLVNLDGEVVGMTHGGTDQNPLPHDGPPEPSEPVVYDWPVRWKMWSLHVPVETVIEHYEDWR